MYTEFPVDGKMRELTRHGTDDFPIQNYVDELHRFSGHTIPLHWHPELEIWKAEGGNVTVQVGSGNASSGRRFRHFHQCQYTSRLYPAG